MTAPTPNTHTRCNRLMDGKSPGLTTVLLLERIALALEKSVELQIVQNLRLKAISEEIGHHA
jgi:hypothetical protein